VKPSFIKGIFGELEGDLVKFRNGYWQHTILRILALADFQSKYEGPLLHVEGDVLLLPNFPFQLFNSLKTIAYPLVNKGYGCASVLFCPTVSEIEELNHFFVDNLKEENHLTDMDLLGRYQSSHAEKVAVLPSAPPNENEFQDWVTENEFALLSRGSYYFEGIFDGATIGQYLLGEDPHNHFGMRPVYRMQKHHSFNARKGNFFWDRRGLRVVAGNESLSIYAIHVHSKDLRAFQNPSNLEFIKSRTMGDKKKIKYEPIPALVMRLLPSLIIIKVRHVLRSLVKLKSRLLK
jgi:hypothetical protein